MATSDGDVTVGTATYCPVCSPVYTGTAQYQRYVVPPAMLNNGYCRRPAADMDVYWQPTHRADPDLLGPLAADTPPSPPPAALSSPLQTCSAAALRAVSCSAPDLIELSSRLPVDQEPQQDIDNSAEDRQVRCVTSLPVARQASQSTVVVCGQVSPSRTRHRTITDEPTD